MLVIRGKHLNITEGAVVTVGKFDGLHLGHKHLISTAVDISKQAKLKSIVFSFFPHPNNYFKCAEFLPLLSEEEKISELEKMGIEILVKYPFDKSLVNMTPKSFIYDVLLSKLNARIILVGPNFRFGKGKAGDAYFIKSSLKDKGVEVKIINSCTVFNSEVSSSGIRQCIYDNDFITASSMLGEAFFIIGLVKNGLRLGSSIGIPTANVECPVDKLVPSCGVYITSTEHNGIRYKSVTSIGNNPTVKKYLRSIETHILDFSRDIYAQQIKVYFHKKIREQQKFDTIEALKIQISHDINMAKDFFDHYSLDNNSFIK